jgi:hypothetical protein
MNTGYFGKLLDRCTHTEIWDELYERSFHGPQHQLGLDQVAFISAASDVETWTLELERVLEALRGGRDEDYSPQCTWPPAAWLAYHSGRLAAIDIQMNGKLASITGRERDHIPGFRTFSRLFDEANNLEHRLRVELGLEVVS